MRLGIHLPVVDSEGRALTAAGVAQRARDIEAAGFNSVWLGDHIGGRPDALMMLLVAAAATERLEVGTAILQLPLRNPGELARRFLTLHALTRGRFSAGVGSGSAQRSFDAIGEGDRFARRFQILREDLSTIRRLCRGERVGEADLQPLPEALGGPPIIIGAWASGIWVKRAAREYEGWMASGGRTNLKNLAEGIKRYRDEGGKRAMVATILVDLSLAEGPLDEDSTELRGDLASLGRRYGPENGFTLLCGPKSASERLHRLADLGFDDALLVKRNPTNIYGDLTEEDLHSLRSLTEPDFSTPYADASPAAKTG
jgi:alkanesulfonate monooxygenase SsuD/methylene tetrahydromethanopterin reductase-like flavin-dependent oxidoreductase (luciferase family)